MADASGGASSDRIMHARLDISGQYLMGADAPPDHYHAPAARRRPRQAVAHDRLTLITIIARERTVSTGARVTAASGRAPVRDGPFAEAKEMVGGFFLLSCATRAQALQIARECPAAQWATIEVRELGACFQ